MYNFIIEYNPGKENVVPDWLSRPPTDLIDKNDYLDNVVAAITIDDESDEKTSDSDQDENTIIIAKNPSSVNLNEFQSLNDEQIKDDDIQWIKNLI